MVAKNERVIASCSFCLKANNEVAQLVAGPGVYICGGCVELCNQIVGEAPSSLPRLAPWEEELDLEHVLVNLPRIAAAGAQVDSSLIHWVNKARSLGATWVIGQSLEMTRQSAWERFSGGE